jgi:hypothetical protein
LPRGEESSSELDALVPVVELGVELEEESELEVLIGDPLEVCLIGAT